MQCDGALHSIDLALQAGVVDARAASHPVGGRPAVERVIDRGGDGRVANAHLAQAQKVGAAGNGFHAEGEGRSTTRLVEGCGLGDVLGGNVERQLKNLQAEVVGGADLVDGRPARSKCLEHGPGHCLRIGRDALRHDAVVRREDRDERALHDGQGAALPGGEMGDDLLEPSQCAGRFDELRVAGMRVGGAFGRGRRHLREESADVVEGQTGCGHGHIHWAGTRRRAALDSRGWRLRPALSTLAGNCRIARP